MLNSERKKIIIAIVLGSAAAPPPLGPARAAEITAERSERGVLVKIDGQLFTEYITNSAGKPILWPLIGPTGKPVTRPWPITKAGPNDQQDHPHQRSLWFTHGEVQGVNFWVEKGKEKVGKIEHVKFSKIASGTPAVVATQNSWLAPDGKKVCEDERTLRFGAGDGVRWIDFDITIKAANGPVTFGDTKEGAFGVRVAGTMTVDAKQGGQIVNSHGQTDGKAWGQPAEWVDYHGPVEGQTVGIAIFNHPSSFRFPTCWHVRTYGLFAANPFGLSEFTGGKKHGGHTLPAGESLTLRYRVLLHRGDHHQGKVAEAFAGYAKQFAFDSARDAK